MKGGKYRVLLLCDRPVQYGAPLCRRQAHHPQLDVLVAYCSLEGAVAAYDPGFAAEVGWDVPLLDGYKWIVLYDKDGKQNRKARPGFFSKTLWRLVRNGGFDAIHVSGYYFREAWAAMACAKWSGVPIVFSIEMHDLKSVRVQSRLMLAVKKAVVGRILRLAGAMNTGSSGATACAMSLGFPEDRICLAGNVVDNDWWTERAALVDRSAVREAWNVPLDARVVLFCAKLQPWKRPIDMLEAFTRAQLPNTYLVFAGEGPMRKDLGQRARDQGVADRVRFLGFVNQTGLPSVYCSSDALVLPSGYEPFGVVVNEAMLCGCPAIVSDRVGAKFDLVRDGETGYVYPCGDVEALANALRTLFEDRSQFERVAAAAKERMKTWTPEMNVSAFVRAVQIATASRDNARPDAKTHAMVSAEKQ
jgi:glycosyltransferase involved in cell wall biosynthesis